MLGRAGAPAAKTRLHLTYAAGPRHPCTALLARKSPDWIPPSNVPCVDNGRGNDEDDGDRAWERHRGNYIVHHGAENPSRRRHS